MKRLLLLITICISLVSSGQNSWIQIYTGMNPSTTHEDHGESVKQTSDGGFVIAGDWDTSICLIRTDDFGNELWKKKYLTEYTGRAKVVKQINDGGFIFAGYVWDPLNWNRGFIVRTDEYGDTLWTRIYEDMTKINSIVITSDGGFALTASSNLGLVVRKINGQGNDEWFSNFDNYSSGEEIFEDQQGGYFVWGERNSSVVRRPALLKLNLSGDSLWTKVYNETSQYSLYGIDIESACIAGDGGLIVLGAMWYPSNYASIYILKTDNMGNEEWSKLYSSVFMVGYDIKPTNDGGFILIAETEVPPLYEESTLLMKTNSNGDSLWTKTFGTPLESDYGFSVEETTDGGFVFTGFTESYGTPGTDDIWLVKTNSNGVVSSSEIFLENNLNVYPNPTTSSITISSETSLNSSFRLIDEQGRVVLTGKIESSEQTVDISKLSKGQYNLVFEDESIPVVSVIKQ